MERPGTLGERNLAHAGFRSSPPEAMVVGVVEPGVKKRKEKVRVSTSFAVTEFYKTRK